MFSGVTGLCLNDDHQTFTVVLPYQYKIFRCDPFGLVFSKECQASFGAPATFDGYRLIALIGSPSSSSQFNSKAVRVFDHKEGRDTFACAFSDHVLAVKIGGNVVIAACLGKIEVWRAKPKQKMHSFPSGLNIYSPLDLSRDCNNFIMTGANPRCLTINRGMGNDLKQNPMNIDDAPVSLVKFSDDTLLFGTAGFDATVTRIWEFSTNACVAILDRGHSSNVQTLDFSPGNEYVATCGRDGNLRIFDIRRRSTIAKKTTSAAAVLNLGREVHMPRVAWLSTAVIVVVTLDGDFFRIGFDGSNLRQERVSFL
jgi:WD40 repeat protein